MAIYSISKIQHRRGKRIDLPQPLSSAEFGWAVDSQELFIGNGSVSEGAPAIGNTKILTEHDNILQLISQYQYKINEFYINTAPNGGITSRTLQDRLDDWVCNTSFSIVANDNTDQAAYIQNALDTLYANDATADIESARVVLNFLPGEYTITSPVYIPSYTTLIGAGKDKTVFKFTGEGKFIFVGNSSTLSLITQPKYCILSGFTIRADIPDFDTPLVLNCIRNSVLSNIRIKNSYLPSASTPIGVGMFLYSPENYDGFQSNIFHDVTLEQFKYGVYSYSKFFNNDFDGIDATYCTYGIQSGHVTGDDFIDYDYIHPEGSVNNIFRNGNYTNITNIDINIEVGTGNIIVLNRFDDYNDTLYPDIHLGQDGNYVNGNTYGRESSLRFPRALYDTLSTDNYYPAVTGSYEYHYSHSRTLALTGDGSTVDIFRLPMNDNSNIEVSYILKSLTSVRKGKFSITTTASDSELQFSDDFTYTGSTIGDIIFDASQDPSAIYITSSNLFDEHTLTYTYTIIN